MGTTLSTWKGEICSNTQERRQFLAKRASFDKSFVPRSNFLPYSKFCQHTGKRKHPMMRSNRVILSKGTCPFKRDDEKIEFDFF